jgi:hypothetical protein
MPRKPADAARSASPPRALQPDLFADTPAQRPPPAGGAALVRVSAAAGPLSKSQRDFNRLTGQVEARRRDLAQWTAMQDSCQQRAAARLLPLQRQLLDLQRDTVRWIDGFLAGPPAGQRLPGKQRRKLGHLLVILARGVLEQGEDPEVEAAHDRHARRSHADDQREQLDLAAGLMGEAVGDHSLFEGDAGSMEELLQRAAERLQQRIDDPDAPPAPPDGAASAGRRPPGQGPGRAGGKAAARLAQAQQEASQSVREVFRRLASSLHPDRETDPAERERKTALMSRVNEAYGRHDLLALLTVQMEIEQIDAEHLASLPEVRLKHYCHVLRDQLQALDDELRLLVEPVALELARPAAWVKPRDLAALLERDLAQTRRALEELTQDSLLLRNDNTRQAFLRTLQVDDPDLDMGPFDEALIAEFLATMPGAVPRRSARRKQRPK